MKISKLQVKNFQGIRGIREYDLNDTVIALYGQNGIGKTSFLNAFRYAVTGAVPNKDVRTLGENDMAVRIVLPSGESYTRRESVKNGAPVKRYLINDKPSNLKTVNDQIQNRAGVKNAVMRVVSSAEVLNGLDSKDLESLILSYIPRNITKETVRTALGDIPQDMSDFIDGFLPEGNFGIEELDELAQTFTESRKAVKRESAGLAELVKTAHAGEAPKHSAAEYRELLQKNAATREKIAAYREQKNVYLKAVAEKKRRDAEIADMKAQIEAISEPYHKPEEILALKEKIAELEKSRDNTSAVCTQMEIMIRDAKEMLEKLEKPVCPLSDKITCTADKEPIKKDYEEELKVSETLLKKQKKIKEETEKKIEALKETVEKYGKDNIAAEKRGVIEARLNKVMSQPVTVPEEPEAPGDADAFAKEYNELIAGYGKASEYEKAEDAKKRLEEDAELIKKYDFAVEAFAPKGTLRRYIIAHYVKFLEDRCNKKIAALNEKMRISFNTVNGVKIMVSPDGGGIYADADIASGGEKAVILYAVMDMLNALSGLKIMILDELSVLDSKAFKKLVGILAGCKDEYDHIFIAAAEHADIKKAIDGAGIGYIALGEGHKEAGKEDAGGSTER